jgi:hypothetical protein
MTFLMLLLCFNTLYGNKIYILLFFNFQQFLSRNHFAQLDFCIFCIAFSLDVRQDVGWPMERSATTLTSASRLALVSTVGPVSISSTRKCIGAFALMSFQGRTVISRFSPQASSRPLPTSLLHLSFVFSSCSVS